jgi:hypothetical protein
MNVTSLEYKKFCKVILGTPIRYLIPPNELKIRKIYKAGTRKRFRVFFFQKIETNYHSFSSCIF